MEGRSTGNSRRKSYTAKFKLEVIEVAKEKGNREAGRLFNVGESSVPKPFFVQITCALSVGNLSNVYRACSFFTISDPFCIDNMRVIGQKIRYLDPTSTLNNNN